MVKNGWLTLLNPQSIEESNKKYHKYFAFFNLQKKIDSIASHSKCVVFSYLERNFWILDTFFRTTKYVSIFVLPLTQLAPFHYKMNYICVFFLLQKIISGFLVHW